VAVLAPDGRITAFIAAEGVMAGAERGGETVEGFALHCGRVLV
jgi:hypothetical protein